MENNVETETNPSIGRDLNETKTQMKGGGGKDAKEKRAFTGQKNAEKATGDALRKTSS